MGPREMRMGSVECSTMRNISVSIVRVIKYRRLRWAGHVIRMGEGRSALKLLTGKHTGKRPLGSPRRIWEDNITMVLKK